VRGKSEKVFSVILRFRIMTLSLKAFSCGKVRLKLIPVLFILFAGECLGPV